MPIIEIGQRPSDFDEIMSEDVLSKKRKCDFDMYWNAFIRKAIKQEPFDPHTFPSSLEEEKHAEDAELQNMHLIKKLQDIGNRLFQLKNQDLDRDSFFDEREKLSEEFGLIEIPSFPSPMTIETLDDAYLELKNAMRSEGMNPTDYESFKDKIGEEIFKLHINLPLFDQPELTNKTAKELFQFFGDAIEQKRITSAKSIHAACLTEDVIYDIEILFSNPRNASAKSARTMTVYLPKDIQTSDLISLINHINEISKKNDIINDKIPEGDTYLGKGVVTFRCDYWNGKYVSASETTKEQREQQEALPVVLEVRAALNKAENPLTHRDLIGLEARRSILSRVESKPADIEQHPPSPTPKK